MTHSPKFALSGDALVSFLALCGLLGCVVQASRAQQQAKSATLDKASVATEYGNLPLSFEENRGQADPRVRYTSRGKGYELFLTANEAVLSFAGKTDGGQIAGADTGLVSRRDSNQGKLQTESVRMQLVGAKEGIVVSGQDALPGTANYFLSNDRSKWQAGVPTYGRVRYTGVYDGVDLVYYGNQRQLEYDFVVAPHADPRQIRLHFGGASQLKLAANGDLEVVGRLGRIAFHKPDLYQDVGDRRRVVNGRFTLLAGNTIGFSVAPFDHSRPLVIDPVLVYSTFVAGAGSAYGDYATSVAVDSAGNTYITGTTYSVNFPVTISPAPLQSTQMGVFNAFVSKLNASGTALLYSTYLGGEATGAYSVKVDSAGNAYIAGFTLSGFPVTDDAFQVASNETNAYTGFVTKLNATGTALVYSTYLGGSGGEDILLALALDASGSAYVTGYTSSATFPVTKSAFQTVSKSAAMAITGLVTKLNATGTGLAYSTYLSGTAGAQGTAIAVDSSGDAYVAGSTFSSDFPVTAGAYQSKNLDTNYGVGFVTKLNSGGTAEIYSTYLGGSGLANATYGDSPFGIAVDSSGVAYVAGATASVDFPVTNNAYQTTEKGLETGSATGFVTKLNTTGTGLLFSTFLGGSGQYSTSGGEVGDSIDSIAVDSTGNVFVGGGTRSSDFPISAGAYQTQNNDTMDGVGFIAEFDPTGSKLQYSTYFGGSLNASLESDPLAGDAVYALALDAEDNVYLAGSSLSIGFPITASAFQTTNKQTTAGGTAGFVAKLNFAATTSSAGLTITPSSLTFPATTVGSSAATQVITLQNSTSSAVTFTAATTLTGTGSSSFTRTNSNCTSPLPSGASCTNIITFTPQTAGTLTATVTYTDSASASVQTVELSGTGESANTGLTVTPGSLTFSATPVGTSAATQTITLKNTTSAAVTFTGATTITGSGASSFSRANTNCTSPLAAGASCTNVLTFTPQSAGALSAAVSYYDSASSTSQTVALSGTGASASTGITITPSALTFPSTTVGSSAATQMITLKNTTASAVSFTATTTITGTGASSFSRTNTNCTSPLAVEASCTNVITFTPQSAGTLTATVTYSTSASSTPQTVALSGTGATASAGLSITPSALTFASTTVGSSATTQTITLKNTTSSAVTFTAATTITGSGAGSFSRANTNCTSPLAAGASCTNVVTFTPQSAGALSAAVSYYDSASSTAQTMALSGTGASASTGITITPSSLTFPSTSVGSNAATQMITLKNTTSFAVSFTATTTITGTGASSFSRTNTNCTSPLAAGASCTNVITFTPQSAGSLTATVTYSTSASSTPQTVALSGTGASAGAGLLITPSSLTVASNAVLDLQKGAEIVGKSRGELLPSKDF